MMCLPNRSGRKASKDGSDVWLVVSALVDISDSLKKIYHRAINAPLMHEGQSRQAISQPY